MRVLAVAKSEVTQVSSFSIRLLIFLLIRAGFIRQTPKIPIYGFGQCNVVPIKEGSRRLFILDQCFGISSSGSETAHSLVSVALHD
jgi:hypothetical protein